MSKQYSQSIILGATYDLWISGVKLSPAKKQYITGISLTDTVVGADSVVIKLSDPEFTFINDNLFVEENKIKVKWGIAGFIYRETFSGYISAIDIDFESDGVPKITLNCMDNTHRMNRKKKSRTWKNCTSASVVKKIVKAYGFTYVGQSKYKFKKQETITQSDQTDIEFITSLAGDETHPFTARLTGKKFYYVKKGNLKDAKMTLTYRNYPSEIISFKPQINTESKKSDVSSATVSSSKKKTSSSTIKNTIKKGTSSNPNKESGFSYNPETKKWTKN